MNEARRSNVLLIMGSVRAGRRCPHIAQWVRGIVDQSQMLRCEVVDLKDWSLPADDEPGIPAAATTYANAATRAWSAKVAAADGVIVVTPQYNWGYPAPLKNALDHLYREWGGKPLMIVTYGGHGGGKCAEQLRQVADGLKMRPVATMPAITIPRAAIESGAPFGDEALNACAASVRQAVRELEDLIAATPQAQSPNVSSKA